MNVTADLAQLAADLRSRLPDSTTEGASFAELNTYRVGGPVAVLVRVHDVDALATVADAARRHQPRLLVIGRGSNLLVGLKNTFAVIPPDTGQGMSRYAVIDHQTNNQR